jgi:general stress protein 26
MKTEAQDSAELHQLCKLIENIPVAMFTTLSADGRLVSRPMSPLEMDRTGALWFFSDLHSQKTAQLSIANLCFADPDTSTYVSLSGHGEIDTDRARIRELWTPFARPWFPDGPESSALALLKFIPDTAEYWDAPNSKMVRSLAMAASVVTGKPVGMGQHETLTGLSNTSPPAR